MPDAAICGESILSDRKFNSAKKMDVLAAYSGSDNDSPAVSPGKKSEKGGGDGSTAVSNGAGEEKPPEDLAEEWKMFEQLVGESAFLPENEEPENPGNTETPTVSAEEPKQSGKSSGTSSESDSSSSEDESSSNSSSSESSSEPDNKTKKRKLKEEGKSGKRNKGRHIRKKRAASSESESDSEHDAQQETIDGDPSTTVSEQDVGSAPQDDQPTDEATVVDDKKRSASPEKVQKRSRSRSRSRSRRSHSRQRRRRRRRSRSRPRRRGGRRRRRRSRSRGRRSRSRQRSKERHEHRPSVSENVSTEKPQDESGNKVGDRRPSHSTDKRSRSRSPERKRRRSDTRSHRRRRSRSGQRRRRRSRDRARRRPSRTRRRNEERLRRSPSPRPVHRPEVEVHRKRNEPLNFKEKLKQSLMEVQKKAAAGQLDVSQIQVNAQNLETANEKPSHLPLGTDNPLAAMASGGQVTPQQALLQTMAAMHQKAQELTGVAVPKYYNPAAVNPLKYAEQVQKRKLLWSKSKEKKTDEAQVGETSTAAKSSNTWAAAAFSQDQDGKVTAKFRKLMGIKEGEAGNPDTEKLSEEQIQKQQELFQRLDKEYEMARMSTHTHRGVGLGFASATQQFPNFPK